MSRLSSDLADQSNALAVVNSRPISVKTRATRCLEPETFESMLQLATKISESGMVRNGNQAANAAQVLVLMLLAQSRGFPVIEGPIRYHIIENQASMKSDAMLAEFQAAGGRHTWIVTDGVTCHGEFWHPEFHPTHFVSHHTFKEYQERGVSQGASGMKANWRRSGAAMMRARAVTEGVRAVLPGVICGIMGEDEAEPVEVTASEQSAQSRLVQALKAKLPGPASSTTSDPVVDVESTPVLEAPARAPSTAWGAFVSEAVNAFNAEITRLAGLNPSDPRLKTKMHATRVANHIVRTLNEQGMVQEDQYKTGGKQDGVKVAAVIQSHWGIAPEFVKRIVDDYIFGQMEACSPSVQEATREPGDDEPTAMIIPGR